MTLDDLYKQARNALDWRDVETPEPEWAHTERVNLARAVLAMLPVVRAAEAWRADGDIRRIWALQDALDTLHTTLSADGRMGEGR